MARSSGASIEGTAHLLQSIGDILSTPIGSRALRRDYGSQLPRLVDAPMNDDTMIDVFVATAEAIDTWEPRFKLSRVQVSGATAGVLSVTLIGDVQSGVEETFNVEIGVAA